MKLWILSLLLCTACQSRHVRMARDVTPGNPVETQLNWRYGANDMRIQTTKLTKILMDRWQQKTCSTLKPTITLTEVDNRTDMYIPTDMLRDILEGVAINDGRFTMLCGDAKDERELFNRGMQGRQVPQFLAKVRLTKAHTETPGYIIEDYRMTMTLYDVESGACVDQSFDLLRKHVQH